MTFNARKLKDSQVELTIELNKEDLFSFATEAEKRLASQVKLKGFRPGKAPKERVRKEIGEQVIKEEALNLAVQSSLAEVLAKEDLDVLEQEDFKIKENSPDKLIYQINLVICPAIEIGGYKGLAAKKNPVAVDEAEIKNTLNDIIGSRTIMKEIERPASLGDRVEVDFIIKDHSAGSVQAAIIEGGKSENYPVVLGENKFVPGFETQIVGMSKGETKTFSLKIPADYYQKTIAGKELDFEVVLKIVQERTMPKLDDDFAKSLGNFQSLEELKNNIKHGLTLEKEHKEKERVRLALLKYLADKTNLEAPARLVEKKLDSMIQGFDGELHEKGMELGLYLAHIKKTQDDLRHEWRNKAEEQVKLSLIVRAIAKKEHIKINEEEIAAELQTVLQQYMASGGPGAGQDVLQNINPEELKNKIHDVLLNEKVFQLLEKNATFT